MAVKLKRVQDAVREANAMLEERVEARTAELRAANAALRIEIAERERAQQALFAQSKELEGFYRHTVTPLVFLDRDFNFIRVNDAYARTCLREVSEFPGHNHFEFYPSAELEGRFREVVETGRPYEVFARPFTFPDHPEWGITYWNLSLSPVLDAKGGVEFLVFSLEDVTARTVAERRSEVLNMAQALFMTKPTRKEYLDAVVKVVQDWTGCENVGVRVVDDRCEIAYESYLGFSEGFMDIENHISLDRDACICVRVVAGILDAEEAAVKTANGSFCCNNTRAWMEELPAERRLHYRGYCVACGYQSVAVIPIRHFNDPLGAIHLADTRPNLVPPDTVEFLESLALLVAEAIRRFNVEEALRRSQARLAEAQRIAHLGSWEWHVASGELRWSDEVFRILGAPPQSFVPTYARFLDVVHPEDRTRVEEAVDLALRQVSGYDCEHRILRPNGEIRIVRDQGEVTFDDSGAPVSMLGTVMDITEQVYAQEQAQLHQQKLLQADKMVSLGILVSGVAHEINNPNHSIMANVGALAEVWQSVQPILDRFEKDFGDFVLGGFEYSESRDKIPEMFSNALVNSKRIELIVNELRDFARYSPQDKMAAVDVNAVVQSASILVSNLTRKHTAHFVLEYGTLLPPVKGNYQRLEQVIINLVQNACQSLPDRSRSVRVITSFDADSDQVRLEVHDEGVGIPAKDLIRLGDPFFTSKRGLGGMGLGLWISFNIVREHGGTLTFTSEEGAGTCALVTLPAMPGQISESGGEAPRKGDA
jgi:PAS domain S-box-containing protein